MEGVPGGDLDSSGDRDASARGGDTIQRLPACLRDRDAGTW